LAIGTTVATIGLVASVVAIWGPIWPTDPDIHPQNTVNGSSSILPFTVKNKSILFGIWNAEFACGAEKIYVNDGAKHHFGLQNTAVFNGYYSIRPEQTINYTCDASKFVSFGTNPPAVIEKMCVWITADYDIFGFWTHHFSSVMFQWPAMAGQNQWLEGPVYRPPPPTKCFRDSGAY
jgi:hypothetical protein